MKYVLLFLIFSFAVQASENERSPLLTERAVYDSEDAQSSLIVSSDSETDYAGAFKHKPTLPPKKWSFKKKATLALMSGVTVGMGAATIWASWPNNRSFTSVPLDLRFVDCQENTFVITGECSPGIEGMPICWVNHCQSTDSVTARTAVTMCTNLVGMLFGAIATSIYALHD